MQQNRVPVFSPALLDALGRFETTIDKHVSSMEHELVRIRRHMHTWPEPSGEETETTAFIIERLENFGLTASVCENGLGVVADVSFGETPEDAPLIAIRADIDALRLTDRKSADYASRNEGVMHACGHDAHTAVVLGVAGSLTDVINAAQDPPSARLRFIFQPAEETCDGAHWMVRQGAMEGVDAILALHVDPHLPVGSVGIRYGVLTAHCEEIHFRIEGKGGHSARPYQTTDPLAASAQLISSLYQMLPRATDVRMPAVFTIGQIEGGHACNVIPDQVTLRGSLRTTDAETRQTLMDRIREICCGLEAATGNRIMTEFHNPLSAVRNDRSVTSLMEAAARRIVEPGNVQILDLPSLGGEDFSVYLDYAPGCQLRLGCASSTVWPPLHSPLFDIDEKALTLGARILVRAALLLSLQATDESA